MIYFAAFREFKEALTVKKNFVDGVFARGAEIIFCLLIVDPSIVLAMDII